MANVFGVDLDDIDTNELIRDEHVKTVYGVLSGDPNYADKDHILKFNGSFLSGSNNSKSTTVDYGFAFGTNNRVGAKNSLVIGRDGESYAENQLVLSGSSINQRGDAQTYFWTKSFKTSPGGSNYIEIPSLDNALTNYRIRINGVEESSDQAVAEDYYLLFFNSRDATVDNNKVGKILDGNRDHGYNSNGQLDNEVITPKFRVDQGSHQLEFKVDDGRGSGNDYRWSVDVKAVEVKSGADVTNMGTTGFINAEFVESTSTSRVVYGKLQYSNSLVTCFTPDMKVQVSKDEERKISELEQGEMVLSFSSESLNEAEDYEEYSEDMSDISNFHPSKTEIENIFYGFVDGYYVLNDEIEVTGTQPVLVYDKENELLSFIDVEFLSTDKHKLLNKNKEFVDLESIEKVEEETEVITLDVEESDVFFVKDILFHNKS